MDQPFGSNGLKPRAERSLPFVLHPESDSDNVHFENSDQHPFMSVETRVGRRNAWWLADAALLSYWNPDVALGRLRSAGLDATFIAVDGVQCYVSVAPNFVIVAFRGTQINEWQNMFDNARFALVPWGGGNARVHEGFAEAFERVRPRLLDVLTPAAASRRVWFGGHSLGGALAVLAAYDFVRVEGIFTMGSPRVGNNAFAMAFNSRLGPRSARYVNNNDMVTRLPPVEPLGYEHVEKLRQIDSNGYITDIPSVDSGDIRDLARGNARAATASLWFSVLDHMPHGYSVDIWNDYARNGD
jgi:triacylglycerol lipase